MVLVNMEFAKICKTVIRAPSQSSKWLRLGQADISEKQPVIGLPFSRHLSDCARLKCIEQPAARRVVCSVFGGPAENGQIAHLQVNPCIFLFVTEHSTRPSDESFNNYAPEGWNKDQRPSRWPVIGSGCNPDGRI
jgi:hypothetical protein